MSFPNPIDPDRYIGTVTQVTASQVIMNLPNATARPERRGLAKGAVGDFVFVDCERVKILGRVVETKVPDGERLTVEPRLGEAPDPRSHRAGAVAGRGRTGLASAAARVASFPENWRRRISRGAENPRRTDPKRRFVQRRTIAQNWLDRGGRQCRNLPSARKSLWPTLRDLWRDRRGQELDACDIDSPA